jgi:hypothetical protein
MIIPININLNKKVPSKEPRWERIIDGFLFSWNFLPKRWIYFAINELRDRSDQYDENNNLLPSTMHVTDRAAVLKIKHLYYL